MLNIQNSGSVRPARFRLSFELGVLFQESPVGIDLKAPFFPVRSHDDLVIPFAIRVVFPSDPNDLSPSRLLIDCLLDGAREPLSPTISPGCHGSCAATLKARQAPITAVNNSLFVFM